MSAIVPYRRFGTVARYGTRAVGAYVPRYRGAMMAYRGAMMAYRASQAYRGGRVIARAGRGIRRSFRRSRRGARTAARRNVGEPIGRSSSKRTSANASTSTESSASRPDRLQNSVTLSYPSEGSGANQRERNLIRLSGFKICMEFQAGSSMRIGGANRDRQATINVCVLSSKNKGSIGTFDNTHFFRSNAGDNRAIDFDVVARSIDFACLPINTDKFNIHMHHRTHIAGEAIEHSPTVRRIMKYIPIKRQIRFDNANIPSVRFFLVWWVTLAGEHQTASFSDIYNVQWDVVTYFRDTN